MQKSLQCSASSSIGSQTKHACKQPVQLTCNTEQCVAQHLSITSNVQTTGSVFVFYMAIGGQDKVARKKSEAIIRCRQQDSTSSIS